MKGNGKIYRDNAKFQVIAHLPKALLAYIFSGIVATIAMLNIQITVISKNLLYVSDDPKIPLSILAATFLAFVVNLPLSFCSQRFYLLISRTSPFSPVPIRDFFKPFQSPKLILKGCVLLLIVELLNALGLVVLVFPVLLSFCMATYFLADNPEMSVFKSLSSSVKFMKGKKWFAFKAVIPIYLTYVIVQLIFSSLYFISFFVTAVIEVMLYVVLAMIYNDGLNE